MKLNVPSFFAGIGTVVVLLALGFGGGVLMSGVISDKPRGPGKVEKWAAETKETTKAPAVAAVPVPVSPPAASAEPAQPPAREENAPAPQASIQAAAPPPQQTSPAALPAPPAPAQAAPPLGQEQPVALTNPGPAQAKLPKPRRENANRTERRQFTERRRPQRFEEETVPDRRARIQEFDDDDEPAPPPFYRGREREEFRRPMFRLFGGDD